MVLHSKTAEYALRAAVHLANHDGKPVVTRDMAEATQVPPGYLSKVLQQLSRGGLVEARRGLHGGFLLARPPAEITILDVINAVDPMPRIRQCPLGKASHGTKLCSLHRQLDDALASLEQAFAQATLADMLDDAMGDSPLCEHAADHGKAKRGDAVDEASELPMKQHDGQVEP